MADKAYSSQAIREHLRRRGIKTTIPVKDDQVKHRKARGHRGGWPPAFDAEIYKVRHAVERCFNALKHKRGVATRYDVDTGRVGGPSVAHGRTLKGMEAMHSIYGKARARC